MPNRRPIEKLRSDLVGGVDEALAVVSDDSGVEGVLIATLLGARGFDR
jgi:hypothetical protein